MTTAILLAAGKGKRMHSRLPKVLHKIFGKPLLYYSLRLLSQLPINDIQVVVGYHKDIVKSAALEIAQELGIAKKLNFVVQKKMLGTGDAVRTVLEHIENLSGYVLVLYGDDSFLHNPRTIKSVLNLHRRRHADITFITLKVKNPTGYGRIVVDRQGNVQKIVEEKVASPAQLKIKEINDGCYVFKTSWLRRNIEKIQKSPVGEYYLTELIEIGAAGGAKIKTHILTNPSGWFGVNTREQLVQANEIMINSKSGAKHKKK